MRKTSLRRFGCASLVTFLILLAVNTWGIDWEARRTQMVVLDLAARGIWRPSVLGSMKAVPRHQFVPKHLRHLSYADRPLPIGEGQTISQPYVVALMTQLLEVDKGMTVLEIGTGSGYQAAVLAKLGAQTYSIEIRPNLAVEVKRRLRELGYKVKVKQGDGYYGWTEHAPFDRIIITAAANHIPRPLLRQLKSGGKLIVPLGDIRYYQNLTLIEKDSRGKTSSSQHGQVRFVPMTGRVQSF